MRDKHLSKKRFVQKCSKQLTGSRPGYSQQNGSIMVSSYNGKQRSNKKGINIYKNESQKHYTERKEPYPTHNTR